LYMPDHCTPGPFSRETSPESGLPSPRPSIHTAQAGEGGLISRGSRGRLRRCRRRPA
jgi:hypothetical protein